MKRVQAVLFNMIQNKLSIPANKLFKPVELKLYSLGMFTRPQRGDTLDLSDYFIDEEGDVYSLNRDTYFTKFGMRLEILSNGARNESGQIVNSFRARNGVKVTITRNKLKALMKAGKLEERVVNSDGEFVENSMIKPEVRNSLLNNQGV